MLPLSQAIFALLIVLNWISPIKAGTFTGACQCSVVKCETTLYVNGCDGALDFGQSSDSAAYCSLQGNVQSIFYKYDDYVHQRSPNITCGGENPTGTGSTECDCSAYEGSDFGDLTVSQISTNSEGYSTSPSSYGENVPLGSCYCDLYSQYSPDGETLLPGDYYSLGSPSSPVYCKNGNEIHANADSDIIASCGTLTNVNGYLPISQTCACSSSSVEATGSTYINSTTSFNDYQPIPSLVAIVQSQMNSRNNNANQNTGGNGSNNSNGSNGSNFNGVKSVPLIRYLSHAQFIAFIVAFYVLA